jgi:sugar fermentation stimulation protein A
MSETQVQDQGAYILILWLKEVRHISIGRLGSLRFKRGYYIYIGSAKKGLSKRIERHKRKKKKSFWHIDYLRAHATFYRAISIRTSEDLECEIASKLKNLADWTIPRFGCSDCQCETHLFATRSDPLLSPSFIEVVSRLSTGRIKKEIEIK